MACVERASGSVITDTSLAFAVLAAAAFGAGVLNAIAGGGTFLTFPALVWAGVPPIAANATSALAVCPGYLGSTLGFRAELAALPRALLAREALLCAIGGVIGALLLLVTPAQVFARVVPWLLLFATALFSFGPRLSRWAGGAHGAGLARLRLPGLAAVAVYGGYFNGGLGIMLLALFSIWGMSDLYEMNGLKNGLSFVLSAISVAAFAVAGLVVWPQAVLMMAASTAGGYAGAPAARLLPRPVLRGLIALVGVGMTAVFALRARG